MIFRDGLRGVGISGRGTGQHHAIACTGVDVRSYCRLVVVMKSSADYRVEGTQLRRTKKAADTRGLTRSHNRTLKHVFKSAAQATSRCEPLKPWYVGLLAKGLRPELARVTIASKIAAVTLAVWKSGASFEAGEVMKQAA